MCVLCQQKHFSFSEMTGRFWWTRICTIVDGNVTNRVLFVIFRSIYAIFESELSVRGVPAYRFVPPSEVFANTTINPDNAGFCVGGNCLSSGLLNVSVCKQGVCVCVSRRSKIALFHSQENSYTKIEHVNAHIISSFMHESLCTFLLFKKNFFVN